MKLTVSNNDGVVLETKITGIFYDCNYRLLSYFDEHENHHSLKLDTTHRFWVNE